MNHKLFVLMWVFLPIQLWAADDPNHQTQSINFQPQVKKSVKFDLSLPLWMMTPKPIVDESKRGSLMVDPGPLSNDGDAPFIEDPVLQSVMGTLPGPTLKSSFFAIDNVAGVSPPDPAGDVGRNHYVAMTNLSFSILDKSGNLLLGPLANNTLWSGFGGDCETDNSGDPIVLYDQISDRWMLSQFTSSSGPLFYNCIAISQTSDPTGAYYRWAILNNNGTADLFPDYPKYGFWEDGLYISTRDFDGGSYAGVGVYAIDRDDLINGFPDPTIIYFFIDRSTDPWQVGDGLLPADIDGMTLPPPGSPAYFVGTMDDGGPYGAPSDAISFWEFAADFNTPANSTFTRTAIIPIASYDTQFPCGGGRNCIPQSGTTNLIDIQSYRQRALHRLAYRNFGTHESLVTNQSVEASAGIGGIRWWELRSPNNSPFVFQEGTYAPGTSDGIHRWMASAAMDQDGNIGLAYSASGSAINPAIRFTGRLATDPSGTMNREEGSIIEGTGSQTSSQRWGDYTSTNVDPLDDCTFWHVNEYYDNNGGDWQIRVGSFVFDDCGDPGFYLNSAQSSQAICVADEAVYDIELGPVSQYNGPVTLSESGVPAPASVAYSLNPVNSLPATTTVTVSNTATLTSGDYLISIEGTGAGVQNQTIDLSLLVFDDIPAQVTLISPLNGTVNADLKPAITWQDNGSPEYTVEVATDPGFNDIVYTDTTNSTSIAPEANLPSNSLLYWRVKGINSCGDGTYSEVRSFSTLALPGECPLYSANTITTYTEDFEAGNGGWTTQSLTGSNDWQLSTAQSASGLQSFLAVDINSTSDSVLISPEFVLPSGQNDLTLQYWNSQSIESNGNECWDGGTLEISTDGGNNFTHVPNNVLLTDPYDGPFTGGLLQGVDAWCGDPQSGTKSVVDLSNWEGQTVRFRFRMTTDVTVGREGWYIDDVRIQSCEIIDLIFEDGFDQPSPP